MNSKEKIIWDSMISTMVMGKVMPIKIIDGDHFGSLNENKFINNLDELHLKEVGIKLAFEIDEYIIRNILKNSELIIYELSLDSIYDAMGYIRSNGFSPNIIFLGDKSRLDPLVEMTKSRVFVQAIINS